MRYEHIIGVWVEIDKVIHNLYFLPDAQNKVNFAARTVSHNV